MKYEKCLTLHLNRGVNTLDNIFVVNLYNPGFTMVILQDNAYMVYHGGRYWRKYNRWRIDGRLTKLAVIHDI